ncbi:MAG: hypothetical protein NTX25_10320, partial [Proteobacteria bacterium]|nr:hypothetical protein [Pseudomonadota bacterium]
MSLLQIRRFVVIVFLVTCNNLIAQDLLPLGKTKLDIRPTDVIIWEGVQALQSKDGQFLVGLRLSTKDKFSIYKSRLEFEAPRPYVLSIQTEPPSRMQDDPVDGGQTEVYDGGDFELKLTGQPWTDAKTL